VEILTVRNQMGALVRSARGLRGEFSKFYAAAYPELVAQSLAITGDAALAETATKKALERAWSSWSVLQGAADPLLPVRWRAVQIAAELAKSADGAGARKNADATTGGAEPNEGAVLVAALQEVPFAKRWPLVLHYMCDVAVTDIARVSGRSSERIEVLLDDGFTTLAEALSWDDEDGVDPDEADELRFDWTADALADAAAVLPEEVTAPSPTGMLVRTALTNWSRRAAPIAAAAACVVAIGAIVVQQSGASEGAGRGDLPSIYYQDGNSLPSDPSVPSSVGSLAAPGGLAVSPAHAPALNLRSVSLSSLIDPGASTSSGSSSGGSSFGGSTSGGGASGGGASGGGASGGGGSASVASAGGTAAAGGGTAASGAGGGSSGGTTPSSSTPPSSTPTTSTSPTVPSSTTTPPPTTTTPPPTTTTPPTTTPPPTTTTTTTTPPPTTTTTTAPVTTTVETTTTVPPTTEETTEQTKETQESKDDSETKSSNSESSQGDDDN
jgi:DNA-directed RNA polymerase specialized sigma24 family protein